MLLIGMKMSFTKKPTNPITTNPIAVRNATFVNSAPKTLISVPDPHRSKQNPQMYIYIVRERYLCDRACGSAWQGGRYPWRTLWEDRRLSQWRPFLRFYVRERERERELDLKSDNCGFEWERERERMSICCCEGKDLLLGHVWKLGWLCIGQNWKEIF